MAEANPTDDAVRRDVLPIPDPQHVGLTTYDARDPNTSYPPIKELRPPTGAPNVLIVLIDDVGFAASSAFGGPCETPVAERLAGEGVKLNRFHTTALCSPTRQALLTGRNHHSVGMGAITEMATSAPGNSSIRPLNKAPIAETSVSTATHRTVRQVPRSATLGGLSGRPLPAVAHRVGLRVLLRLRRRRGQPVLPGSVRGHHTRRTAAHPEEGYTLTQDLADHAITWVRQQQALMPDKPFFMYFAPGATHPAPRAEGMVGEVPRQVRRGLGCAAAEIFAAQKKLGVIPKDAELTVRPGEIPAWDDMADELKPVLSRQMEIYAGFLEQTDHEIGR